MSIEARRAAQEHKTFVPNTLAIYTSLCNTSSVTRTTAHSNALAKIPDKSGGKGISAEYRAFLSELHRFATGPITVEDATNILKLPRKNVMKLLPHFAANGWLRRVKRGLYLLVPLEARTPETWTENDWVIASKIFDPCYIGGWSAGLHFGLTDQLFNTTVVCTTKRVRHRKTKIGEFSFVVRTVGKERLFGLTTVWRGRAKMMVSDPSRTMVDILSAPSLGGGIRHTADILSAYFTSEHRDDAKLMEYIETFGNTAVRKRLGYLIETMGIDAKTLLERCRKERGRGVAYLDPDLPHAGKKNTRWNLVLNATIEESK